MYLDFFLCEMHLNSLIKLVSVETANEQVMFGMNGEVGWVVLPQDRTNVSCSGISPQGAHYLMGKHLDLNR